MQSKIIAERPIEFEVNCAFSHDRVDALPSELISKCASFLKHKDYFRFSHCNRDIYHACYSPPKIHSLHLGIWLSRQKQPLHDLHLQAYKNVSKLTMSLKQFINLSSKNQSTWINDEFLSKLCLYNSDGDDSDNHSFIEKLSLINTDNVHTLELMDFESSLVLELIYRFPGVADLSLEEITADDYHIDKQKIAKLSSLAKLDLTSWGAANTFYSDLLMALSGQLEKLYLHDGDIQFPRFNAFQKLKFLSLAEPVNVKGLEHIKTLKAASINFGTNEVAKVWISDLMGSSSPLERLDIMAEDDLEACFVFEQLELSLMKYRVGTDSKCDKLSIFLSCNTATGHESIAISIFRLINALQASNIQEWSMKLEQCRIPSDFEVDLSILKQLSKEIDVCHERDNERLSIEIATKKQSN